MDHLSFLQYHNRLIKFIYRGKKKEGVVIDIIPYSQKMRSTDYIFVPKRDIETWRDASPQIKERLQETIDIADISTAELLGGFQHA